MRSALRTPARASVETASPAGGAGRNASAGIGLAAGNTTGVDQQTLGVVRFGTFATSVGPEAPPSIAIPLEVLAGPDTWIWRSAAATVTGSAGPVRYRSDGDLLFGTYVDGGAEPERIEQATVAAYRALFAAAGAAGYPHVYRIWNYLPSINREIRGIEVYKSFCIGRQRVFDQKPMPVAGSVPAACAIGARELGFRLYFLAGKIPGVQLSNPRQIEAYDYPPEYGPRSPVFSRAVAVRAGGACQLHLSGTASIVGHATRHHADVEAQVTETLNNLEALIAQTGIGLADIGSDALFTVYLRNAGHLDMVRRRLSTVFSPAVPCLFLCGDICRRSLLVEIEGIIPLPPQAAARVP